MEGVAILGRHPYLVEHFFYVCYKGDFLLSETHEDTSQVIYVVWTLQESVTEGCSTEFGRCIEHNTKLAWFVRVENWTVRQVPCLVTLFFSLFFGELASIAQGYVLIDDRTVLLMQLLITFQTTLEMA